jgi:hypothetical protein
MNTIKRLTKEEVEKIVEARQAKVRHAWAERMKRLDVEVHRWLIEGRQAQDYAPDASSEYQLAEKIIAAYVDQVVDEADLPELRELLQRFAIDPRHVHTFVRTRLAGLEEEP